MTGLDDLKKRAAQVGVPAIASSTPAGIPSLDLDNLLTVSEAIARAAIERKESRGGQFREDYPDKDPEYAKFNIVVKCGPGGEMQVSRVPIPPMPAELKQIIEENK